MAAISEVAQNEVSSPIFRTIVKAARRKKILATGFVDGNRSVLVLMEEPRKVQVFPDMLGSFSVPIRSIKSRKFIDYKT